MSMISDALNLDLDYEPTITPVVDMGNVTSSMDAINNMLNKTHRFSQDLDLVQWMRYLSAEIIKWKF